MKKKNILLLSCCAITGSIPAMTSCSESQYSTITISCMGDSITYGASPHTYIRMINPYPNIIRKSLGAKKSNNYGINSSTVSNFNKGNNPMVDRLNDIDKDSDIIIFWGGVNDYLQSCPLGVEQSFDTTTFYGAINFTCKSLKGRFPNKFIMYMTPLPTTQKTESKDTLDKYCEAIRKTCGLYNIPVLDMYTKSKFEDEMYKLSSDGLHPSQYFIRYHICPIIDSFIRENYSKNKAF